MSAKCQQQTHAPQQTILLLDHLVSAAPIRRGLLDRPVSGRTQGQSNPLSSGLIERMVWVRHVSQT
jgi:hypothetical protein